VLDDLQGQRVAGIVVLSDGRESPPQNFADALGSIKDFGVKIYPVVVGSDAAPRNIEIQTVDVQDSAFKGDIVNVKATIRASGVENGHAIRVVLKDKRTGKTLLRP
jgi:hypothetical protein